MSVEHPPARVLIVDDDVVDREAMRRALQSPGLHASVEEAGSIAEAERALAGAPFDVVLLDYLLPEGPCLPFLPALREKSLAGFIVLTGQGDEKVAVDVMKAGAADYLSKDRLEPARLRRAVRYALSLRRAEHSAAEARAEQERRTDQLRRFVEGSPTLVAARTLQELAARTAALTRSLFSATETFVSLQHRDTEVVSEGSAPPGSPLAEWVTERRSLPPTSGNRVSGDRLAVTLTSRDGEPRGTIAARLEGPFHPSEAHLLDQLGTLVAVCVDNLFLYEAAARAVRARDDILAAVSHDLRTPLNSLRLGASLLSESAGPEERRIVERIDRSIVHMTHLVEDLVDMARIEGGKIDVAAQRESVEDLLVSAQKLVASQAESQRIRLVVEAPKTPLAVRADRHRTLQVLANLLGNAIKFTPESGEVTLRASAEGDAVRFEVQDTGVGVPEVEGERIFERFWRSDPKKRRGLGLGLYIAKGLVMAQGGKLWFESAPGAGSRFFFTLPRVESSP
jgi:signal transduction histidine kinase